MATVHRDSNRDVVAEVKAATDIVEIVGTYLELKTAGGGRFKGLCPFHTEKTPSFIVNRDRQSFHCFGCGKGGDILTFVEELEGLAFPEALRQLADRAGIAMPERNSFSKQDNDLRDRLWDLNTLAAELYVTCLYDERMGSAARDYIRSRNLKKKTVEHFGLGFAPDAWQTLVDAAEKKGFRQSTLMTSGMAKSGNQDRPYDLFRNRVIFPIRDLNGRVAAFGGRDLGDSPAKYINSPESEIYKKSRMFYGLHEAREAIRQSGEAILVEGYFDVLRCVDAGVGNVVATCGTALTPDQAALLRRFANRVVVVFDGDAAGIRAALRSAGILVAAGLSVRAMVLPDDLDPDDYVQQQGAESFLERVRNADDWIAFYVEWSRDRTKSIEGRTEVARELFTIIAEIDDPLRQDEYVKVAARALDLSEQHCRREFNKQTQSPRHAPQRDDDAHAEAPPVEVNAHDREFIAILLGEPELQKRAEMELSEIRIPGDFVLEVVLGLSTEDPFGRLETAVARALYSSAAAAEPTWGDRAEALVEERLRWFKREALILERKRIEEAMREAKRSNSEETLDLLAMEKIGIDQQIQQVGAA